ncbi:MAG: cytochrome c3 family protein [Candidatus Marinimicrobia bacterium]|nr:cytochrome c3 family protein [Candidatus Neomarinimicrobiota bacterium]MBL7010726.1 cytochrome c3 family protein [Candidatus Neomarinimicrobiota bacterium]MBL7029893.1 cytochrome c3 family protein [Candidatus Neomarinimicrobiota bacterium]
MQSLLFLFLPLILSAQFSPGELSKYHAHLEGNTNCTQCHELGKKEISSGCVDCHIPLKEKIISKTGYHTDKQDKCGECHSDHNGKAFELVYWPKNINSFNHKETGYTLTGKHIKLECKSCHTSENIKEPSIIQWAKKHTKFPVLDRTFLGLETTCNSCHNNIHEDQVSNTCENCHNTSDWKLAVSEYDHTQARFLLTGKHEQVDCVKCHPAQPDHPQKVWQLTGMAFENCNSCHENIHGKSMSNDCASCHDTFGWETASKSFDHNTTKFLLTGSHQKVDCAKCHPPQPNHPKKALKLSGIQFDNCTRCHEDIHKGSYGNTCESCHTTVDWKKDLKPFDHNQTKYPLLGKHWTVGCVSCHQLNLSGILPKYDTCLACHEDKHFGQFVNRSDKGDCAACHNVDGFKPTTFNLIKHQTVRFVLEGAHLAIPCSECHKPYKPIRGQSTVKFTWREMNCNICHEDVHRNQFQKNHANRCEDCHTAISFTQSKFNHDKSKFPLDGKHNNVDCEKCHKQVRDTKGIFIRYQPVPHTCGDCHTFTGEIR